MPPLQPPLPRQLGGSHLRCAGDFDAEEEVQRHIHQPIEETDPALGMESRLVDVTGYINGFLK